MTAEKVGKYWVIAVEPLVQNKKGAVPNPTYDRLVLENGDKVFGCKNCDYTSTNTGSMFGHVRRHTFAQPTEPEEIPEPADVEEPPVPAQPTVSESVKNMTVVALLAYISWLEDNGGSPVDLRERAEAAEARAVTAEARVLVLEERIDRMKALLD